MSKRKKIPVEGIEFLLKCFKNDDKIPGVKYIFDLNDRVGLKEAVDEYNYLLNKYNNGER